MYGFLRIWFTAAVAVKRLVVQRWIALATLLGLATSGALLLSIPLYAEGIYHRILFEKLQGAPALGLRDYPPFAYMFRYIGGSFGGLSWEQVTPADNFISRQAVMALGLPERFLVRHFRTDSFHLMGQEAEDARYDSRNPLTWVSFGFVTEFQNHIIVVDGSFPQPDRPGPSGPVDVLLSDQLAEELGLQVGEAYRAFMDTRRTGSAQQGQLVDIPIRVSGIWRAIDEESDFWFVSPKALAGVMIVPEEVFVNVISPQLNGPVTLATWYFVMDGSGVRTADVAPLVARTARIQWQASALLTNVRLDLSPINALQTYRRAVGLLTAQLYAFSVPILALILAFIGLVTGLGVERRRNEISVLRSRGATGAQIVGMAALEGLILGLLGLGIALPVGELIAQAMGRARTFLDFSAPPLLETRLTVTALRLGAATLGVAVLAQVLPTLAAARHNVVTYKQARSRMVDRPWWQRVWLDALLMLPALYGGYQLRQQGSLFRVGSAGIGVDPFQNPLLILVPSLGIFAVTLFAVRILPTAMTVAAWVASHGRAVGSFLAARQLSRSPGAYSAPLILVVMTLSLSAFVASLAQTLDRHARDQAYYHLGADVRIVESTLASASPETAAAGGGTSIAEGSRWYFLPASEYLRAPGVEAVSRVGRYTAFHALGGGLQPATFMGVDRADFAAVAFWRQDFATQSLGALMNNLAAQRDGVLVPSSFLRQHALGIGDRLPISVDILGDRIRVETRIVGAFDLFPTWIPESERDGTLFVGNLDYLFEQAGGQLPYNVWLKTGAGADYRKITEDLVALGLRVQRWQAPEIEIADNQLRPERQGVFGVLSIGFIAAALLTALGFLLYALFTFRRRFIELGVLRAIGLSTSQMASLLAWELLLLIGVGLAVGTGLGAWVSHAFIPYLQVGAEPAAQVPPFVVTISWTDVYRFYTLFALLFVAAFGALVVLLLRMRIFQAIKLGEAN